VAALGTTGNTHTTHPHPLLIGVAFAPLVRPEENDGVRVRGEESV